MRLIALRPIRKVPMLARLKLPPGLHIERGTIFEIGAGDDPEKMPKEDAELVGLLSLAKCIGLASDAAVVKAVQDEIAAEALREKRAAGLAR